MLITVAAERISVSSKLFISEAEIPLPFRAAKLPSTGISLQTGLVDQPQWQRVRSSGGDGYVTGAAEDLTRPYWFMQCFCKGSFAARPLEILLISD